ncbi:Site-specific DNA methylase [Hoeflea phototrophica DFL-43]|uniref:site-specific DNA-methyltransferase (adenine-specific) n=1 Tax=Hoeflea phototrophica (strain DSM 17068 / NCIMB 14078 / DFL-43) TaxID=411684 RepID=A9D301_HOEPD|nr:DNA adenine methylase [Hoeflea phototrophica]EDQ34307.1 Site-specific DNA methylase [Hoeflea phototrophica DFL-43]
MSNPVKPISPPAAYIGGKRILAKAIIERINATPHTGYAEPFVGMGGVFLRRASKPRTEVINDFNGEVANLFRILQRHYPQFMETLKFQITSRREFQRLVGCDPATLTDLERAARFLYLQRLSFGGKVTGQNFGVAKDGGGRFNITRLGPVLEDIHERMAGVVIEQLDWRDFLKRWDRPGMLFYLDPPYYGNEDDYGPGMFSRSDFEEMAATLKGLRGGVILSLNDRPEVRAIFKGFAIKAIDCTYSIAGGVGKKVKEVIVSKQANKR